MLSASVRILNFDDSVVKQEKLLRKFHPQIVDLKKIGPLCRNWADEKTAREIRASFDPHLKNSVTFLGSGDFHHISSLLIEQFDQPLSVIVFDHHPDWDILPPRLGCGSWVSHALKRANIEKFILMGVSSEDIEGSSIHTADLGSLKNSRVEIYPYMHRPTGVVFRKVPENISLRVKKILFFNLVYWQELKNKDINDFFRGLLKRMPTKAVYVSIDKDCLRAENSLTNWEEGNFRLDELLGMLKLIRENLEIIGLDILGDYSLPDVWGTVRGICASLDHPRNYSAKGKTEALLNYVNEQTNMRILDTLMD